MYLELNELYEGHASASARRTVRMPRKHASSIFDPEDGPLAKAPFQTFHADVEVVREPGSSGEHAEFIADQADTLTVFAGAAFAMGGGSSEGQLAQLRREAALSERLNELGTLFFEDYGHSLDPASVMGLRLFLLAHMWAAMPSLSADSLGRVVATWRLGSQSVSLKFLDNQQFHYAMAVETEAGKARPWGTAGRFEFFAKRPEARTLLGKSAAA